MQWTDDDTKYAFAALCLLQAITGATLGVIALEPSSKSLAPYGFDYKKNAMENQVDEARNIINQQESAVSAFSFNRLSQIILVLSVVSGLVINFPWFWWIGLLFWLGPVVYALALMVHKVRSGWRVAVYKMAFEQKLERGWIPLTADVRRELTSVMTAPRKDLEELKAALDKRATEDRSTQTP